MTVQEIQFELIKKASFNGFDGPYVVKSLEQNPKLWRGVVLDRGTYCFHGSSENVLKIDLIKLRDIQENTWNVDTLFILPEPGKESELEEIAREWGADEVDWIGGREAGQLLGASMLNGPKQILRVWFD
jgi:hypothetical protein